MSFENYEGTAIDPSAFGQLETEPTPVDEPIVDTQTNEGIDAGVVTVGVIEGSLTYYLSIHSFI